MRRALREALREELHAGVVLVLAGAVRWLAGDEHDERLALRRLRGGEGRGSEQGEGEGGKGRAKFHGRGMGKTRQVARGVKARRHEFLAKAADDYWVAEMRQPQA